MIYTKILPLIPRLLPAGEGASIVNLKSPLASHLEKAGFVM